MNILHIPTGGLFPDGIYSCIASYISNIKDENINFSVLAVNHPSDEVKEKVKALNVELFIIPYRKSNILKYISGLKKLIKEKHIDIVHIHGSSSIMVIELIAASLAGCKVRIAHSHNTTCTNKKANSLLRPFFNLLYTDAFACGNDAGKWLFGKKPFRLIPNGRDVSLYSYSENTRKKLRQELEIPDNCIAVGHVGRFNPQKNHDFLIDVFEKLNQKNHDTMLFLFGDGTLQNQIKEKVKEKKLESHVKFMGVRENVNEYLSAMDVMLLPSLHEGLPLVLLEWQMCGLPVLVSDTVTTECIINDDVFRLPIDCGAEIWADKLSEIKIVDRNQTKDKILDDMCRKGYDISENAKSLKEIYCTLMRKNK